MGTEPPPPPPPTIDPLRQNACLLLGHHMWQPYLHQQGPRYQGRCVALAHRYYGNEELTSLMLSSEDSNTRIQYSLRKYERALAHRYYGNEELTSLMLGSEDSNARIQYSSRKYERHTATLFSAIKNSTPLHPTTSSADAFNGALQY